MAHFRFRPTAPFCIIPLLMARGSGTGRGLQIGLFGTAVSLLFFIACSLPPAKVQSPVPISPPSAATQTGMASWYGPGFHGRATASGDIYNQYDLTAAHPTLPLGTKVMITNLENGRSAEVTINDRGPFVKGRIIDLSYAAAHMLGMIGPGTIPVRLEVIDSGPHQITRVRSSLDYTLQAGSFISRENAQRLKAQLTTTYPRISQISIVPFQGKAATYYRVQLGTFADRREAEDHARQLSRLGFAIIIMEK